MSEAIDSAERLESVVVGVKPWLPWPLSRSRWWMQPAPAERLAALRIGIAAMLLLDILSTYLPYANVFFGRDSLGRPEIFQGTFDWDWNALWDDLAHLSEDMPEHDPFRRSLGHHWRWSLLHGVENPRLVRTALVAWIAATTCLLLGLSTRLAAIVVWLLSTSFATANSYIDNGGDQIRYIVTLYLMLTPCGAAWSLDAWLRRRHCRLSGRAFIYPWALRLLFVQMVLMYWCNGLYKLSGQDWPNGDTLYYVLGDLTLTRWSPAQFPVPYLVTKLATWVVLAWEVTFPLWVCLPWRGFAGWLERHGLGRRRWLIGFVRHVPTIALLFGVAFHLGIGASMELGFFVPYALCLYLPLLPWERLSRQVSTAKVGASTLAKSA